MPQKMKQIVSLSGGKDSTAMLLMMLEKGEQIDDIVFFDWGMEFEEMYEHLQALEDYIGRSITRLYPPNSFEFYMLEKPRPRSQSSSRGYGWPNGKVKWCSRYKADWINQAYKNTIMCLGYAYEERFSRAKASNRWQYRWGITVRYPLLEWGVTEIEALKYCYSKGFDWGGPDGLYTFYDRASCWCCPFQNRKGLIALKDYFPELWERLLELDDKSPYPHPQKELLYKLKETTPEDVPEQG